MEFIAFTFIEDSILLRLFLVLFLLLVTYAVIIYLIETLFINRYPFVNINTDKVEASDLFLSVSSARNQTTKLLNRETFYKNLNNSSQYLRRDSYSANEFYSTPTTNIFS
ncbi:hypothetical protein MG7_03005 [Candida albicans P34048]|nr:hypothetical protein MG7_03005 [Candida albicans P34048]KGU30778.1 Planktonic growth-induced protein [Candida albicans P57055]